MVVSFVHEQPWNMTIIFPSLLLYSGWELCIIAFFYVTQLVYKHSQHSTQVKEWMNEEYSTKVRPWIINLNLWSWQCFFFFLVQEYETAFQLIRLCFPNERIEHDPTNPDWFRLSLRTIYLTFFWLGQLMTSLLPVLMMRHRRVPRLKRVDHITPTGKHWNPNPPVIGYHLTFSNSLCGMAVTQGMASTLG